MCTETDNTMLGMHTGQFTDKLTRCQSSLALVISLTAIRLFVQ